tara:strand:+ start:799 stop:1014 length:216 start_codon:yes stop_codon:yes gene_type:complete
MATQLTKPVVRETKALVRDRSRMRPIVITLEAGHQGQGMISLKLKGNRQPPLTITPERLYLWLERRAAGLA